MNELANGGRVEMEGNENNTWSYIPMLDARIDSHSFAVRRVWYHNILSHSRPSRTLNKLWSKSWTERAIKELWSNICKDVYRPIRRFWSDFAYFSEWLSMVGRKPEWCFTLVWGLWGQILHVPHPKKHWVMPLPSRAAKRCGAAGASEWFALILVEIRYALTLNTGLGLDWITLSLRWFNGEVL